MPTGVAADTPINLRAVTTLNGVGPRMAEHLARLNIYTVQDVLFHLPVRYQDRSRLTPIGSLQPGADAVVEGRIMIADVVYGRRRSLLIKIEDGTGVIAARFFYFTPAQQSQLQRGTKIRCFGEVRRGASGLELYHPEYRVANQDLAPLASSLTAIYPATDGINQNKLRQLVEQAMVSLDSRAVMDLLDTSSFLDGEFDSINAAIRFLHFPPADELTPQALQHLQTGDHPAQKRLALEELVAHQASLLKARFEKTAERAPALTTCDEKTQYFLDMLGFELTSAQQRVSEEISTDLSRQQPMMRLVQGDVGSGKTVIAALAVLQTVGSGFQAAMMAPTEILAEQHFNSFSEWMEPLGIKLSWLTGKLNKTQRSQVLTEISSGQSQVVIGTHALFQEDVEFAQLALVIIDEQHRFGVHQRLSLRAKGEIQDIQPHQLIMTATPIPRTLTMSAYADLDCSIIDELPPGRSPVQTLVVNNQRREEVVNRVAAVCRAKQQVYWVCTLVEESEALQCEAAELAAENLRLALPDFSVGLIHGRLKSDEKAAVMTAFKSADIDILVATTVIEVGVDVPNATLMVIENPERLGLAQLHQLRGRIGRGHQQGYCILLYQPKLSDLAKRRLTILRDHHDGFVIAEKDLEIRGPGEVLGTRQAGLARFKIADLERDAKLLPVARTLAAHHVEHEPLMTQHLIERWLGQRNQYRQV